MNNVCPTIHPYFGISDKELTAHTKEFRDAAGTKKAYEAMEKTIGALVLTAIDILNDDDLLDEINEYFEKK